MRAGEQEHGGSAETDEQRAFAQARGPAVGAFAQFAAATEIFQLAAAALRIADPVPHHPLQPRRIGDELFVAQQAGAAHGVADPAQVDVLFLQKAVVAERIVRRNLDAGQAPVQLHAQAFGEAAIVEVLALPLPVLAERIQQQAEHEQQQESGNVDPVGFDVGIQDEGQAHRRREQVRAQQAAAHAPAEVHRQPIGGVELPFERRNYRRQRRRRARIRQHRIGFGQGFGMALLVAIEGFHLPEHVPVMLRHRAFSGRRTGERTPTRLHGRQRGRRRVGEAARTTQVEDQIALVVGEQVRRHLIHAQAGHHVVQMELHHLRGAAGGFARMAVPQGQQQLAMRGDEHAELAVLPVARFAADADGFRRVAGGERQMPHLRLRQQTAETRQAFRRGEIAFVFFLRHRQRRHQFDAERQRFLRYELIAAFGQGRDQAQGQGGEIALQPLEKTPHRRAQAGFFFRQQIAMRGEADAKADARIVGVGQLGQGGTRGEVDGRSNAERRRCRPRYYRPILGECHEASGRNVAVVGVGRGLRASGRNAGGCRNACGYGASH